MAATLTISPSKLSFALVGSGGISSTNGTLSVDSNQTNFLTNSAAVSCSSSTGKLILETDGNTLGYCVNSTAYRTALGDTSGKALSGDSATGFFSSGILESSIGGTANGFTKFSGPTTSEKTFTLPDASTTICTTNSTCSGYQSALSGGDVTTTSGGASATIGNDKITEAMLKSVNSPTDEQCLTYEATVGDFEWQTCGSGSSGITGITAGTGGTTTGSTVTLAGGTGITTTRSTDTVTVAVSTVPATNGGTGVTSYTANTLYYPPGATPSELLPIPTPTSSPMFLRYNGASTAPSWSTAISSILTINSPDVFPDRTPVSGNQIKFIGVYGLVTVDGNEIDPTDPAIYFGIFSDTPGFLNSSIAEGCEGGEMGLHSPAIGYCDNETVRYTAEGDANGHALTGDSATGFFTSAGALEATNGGTGVSSYTANTMYYAPSATPSALLPVPTPTSTNLPFFLTYNGASSAPSWTRIDLTTGVTGTLPASNGGTGNAYTTFSGPTAARTYTLPDSSVTLQTALSGGDVTTTSGGALATIGNDKITEAMLKSVNAATDEYCLTYEATVGDFEWQTCGSGSSGITGLLGGNAVTTTATTVEISATSPLSTSATTGAINIALGTVPATIGGTGVTSYTANTMYYAPAATPSALLPVPTPTSSPMFLRYNGSSVAPSWSKVDLGTDITSTVLPVANGGTGITSLGTGVATFLGTPSSANLASAVTDETGSGALVFGTSPTISAIELGNASDTTVARGAAGVVTVEGSPVLKTGYTSVATSGGTTALTSTSNYYQYFTGSLTQTVTLPDATSMVVGQGFEIHNNSTGTITVNTSAGAGNQVATVPGNHSTRIICVSNASNTIGSWDYTTQSINQRVTFTGPSSAQTYTLPTTSATLQSTSDTIAFNRLASGTNTTAAMVVGAGSTLSATSTGTITATGINSGAGTDGSRIITMPDNVSATPTPPSAGNTNIHSRSEVLYVQPNHAGAVWGYQVQASQVELGKNSTQAISSTTLASLENIQFNLKANKKYWLQGSLSATASAATADPTYAITISAGTKTIAVRVTCAMVDGTAAYTSVVITADNTGSTCLIAGAGTTGGVTAMFDGYVTTTSDATLDIKAAPAGTGSLTIAAYPLFRVTEFLDP